MRIACISTSKIPGRTANALQLMKACEALVQLGHEIRLWLPDFGGELDWSDLKESYGLRESFPVKQLEIIEPLRRYDFCWRAVGEAQSWGCELLYLWPLQAAALGSQRGVPTLVEMHDRPRGLLGPWLFRLFLEGRGAVRLLATTQALGGALADFYGRELVDPLLVLGPNGVDLDRYQNLPSPAAARRALELPEAFTAAYTGHLYRGRGAGLMVELARRLPDVQFVWAGGTEADLQRWRARVERLANLRSLGFVPNAQLPRVHAAADVLLMPYGEEILVSGGIEASAYASPMKVFEYLAAGRPILSTDLPVLREVLDDETAVLLPPRSHEKWARALNELRDNPARRRQLAERARAKAADFTWTKRAERALAGLAGSANG